jgi:hypothetical protein
MVCGGWGGCKPTIKGYHTSTREEIGRSHTGAIQEGYRKGVEGE